MDDLSNRDSMLAHARPYFLYEELVAGFRDQDRGMPLEHRYFHEDWRIWGLCHPDSAALAALGLHALQQSWSGGRRIVS